MSQSVSDIDSIESILKFRSQRIAKCTLINLPIYRFINVQNWMTSLVLEFRFIKKWICKNSKRCKFGRAKNPHDMKLTDDFGPAYRPREATLIFPRTPNCRDSAESGDLTANVASLFQYRIRLGQILPILTLEHREKGPVLDGALQHNPYD